MKRIIISSLIALSGITLFLMNNCSKQDKNNPSRISNPLDEGFYQLQEGAPSCTDLINTEGRVEIHEQTACNCLVADLPLLSTKKVYGNNTYHVTSDPCAAAKHLDLLSDTKTATVLILPGQQCSYFLPSTNNGITSEALTLVGNEDTFYFKDKGTGECAPRTPDSDITDEDDVIDPILMGSVPANGATSVPLTSNVLLNFSEDVQKGSGLIKIFKTADDSLVEEIEVTSDKVTISADNLKILTINPSADFSSETDYYLMIASGVIKDTAGRNYGGLTDKTQLSFRTAASDSIPSLVLSVPLDEATDFAVTSNIMLKFNEDIEIGAGKITLFKASDDSAIEEIDVTSAAVTITETDKSEVTINPKDNLLFSTDYYLLIAPGTFKNSRGLPFAGLTTKSELNFTTKAMNLAPTLTSSLPANSATDISVNTDVVLTFSEEMKKGTGKIGIFKASDDTLAEEIDVKSAQVKIATADKKIVTINPKSSLSNKTSYYIKIPAGALKDLENKNYAGITDSATLLFTTSEVDPAPTLTNTEPLNNAVDVTLTAPLGLTFSEPIKKGTGTIKIHRYSNDSVFESINVTDNRVTISDSDPTKVTILPGKAFAYNTEYYVKVVAGVFKDSANQPFAGITTSTVFKFKTQTNADPAPTLVSQDPADNASNVVLTTNLTLEFSEEIKKGPSGMITLFQTSNDATFEEINVTSEAVTLIEPDKKKVLINPTKKLAAGTEYYVKITSGAFVDLTNQPYAGILTNSVYNFTTAPVGDPAPKLSQLNPADGANNVALDQTFTLHFSEEIVKGTGKITLYRTSTATLVEEIDVTSDKVSISESDKKIVTINPEKLLANNTTYYFKIAAGAFKDLSNKNFAGINNNSDYNFKTVALTDPPPSLVSKAPASGAVDVPVQTNLVLTFSEDIQIGTGTVNLYLVTNDKLIESISVTDSKVSIQATDQKIVTIDPGVTLAPKTNYYVKISAGAFKDLSNQNYPGISIGTGYIFKTAGPANPPPTLTTRNPLDNATSVPIKTNLVLTFSEEIAKGTGALRIYRDSDDSVVSTLEISSAAVVISDTDRKIVTLNPGTNLVPDTEYYVQIDPTAFKDLGGAFYAGISNSTEYNFRTAAPNPAPSLVTLVPADGSNDVPRKSNLTFIFSEPIKKGSTGSITIYRTSNDSEFESIIITSPKVSISTSNPKELTVDPGSDFAANTSYYVKISNGAIKDLTNVSFPGILDNSTFNFKTSPVADPAPKVVSLSPADGATDVALQASLQMTFSEPIVKGAGNISIYNQSTGTLFEAVNVSGPQVKISATDSKIVTINPTAKFSFNTEYYVKIDAGTFKDVSNQNYAGIQNSVDFNFKTLADADPSPTLASSVPNNGAADVLITTNLELTMSEEVQKGTGVIVIYNKAGDTVFEQINVNSDKVTITEGDKKQIQINPSANLAYSKSYYVKISEGAFKDLTGQKYAGINTSTQWHFKTIAKDLAPTLVSRSPLDGATDVLTTTNILLTFSEDIQKGSGTITIYKEADDSVLETIKVSSSNVVVSESNKKEVTIDPTKKLLKSKNYYIKISEGAFKDAGGMSYLGILNSTDYNFKTGSN